MFYLSLDFKDLPLIQPQDSWQGRCHPGSLNLGLICPAPFIWGRELFSRPALHSCPKSSSFIFLLAPELESVSYVLHLTISFSVSSCLMEETSLRGWTKVNFLKPCIIWWCVYINPHTWVLTCLKADFWICSVVSLGDSQISWSVVFSLDWSLERKWKGNRFSRVQLVTLWTIRP